MISQQIVAFVRLGLIGAAVHDELKNANTIILWLVVLSLLPLLLLPMLMLARMFLLIVILRLLNHSPFTFVLCISRKPLRGLHHRQVGTEQSA
jgi:hypothetical protein